MCSCSYTWVWMHLCWCTGTYEKVCSFWSHHLNMPEKILGFRAVLKTKWKKKKVWQWRSVWMSQSHEMNMAPCFQAPCLSPRNLHFAYIIHILMLSEHSLVSHYLCMTCGWFPFECNDLQLTVLRLIETSSRLSVIKRKRKKKSLPLFLFIFVDSFEA